MNSSPGGRMTAAGFAVMLLAVSAGVGSGEYGALLGLAGVLAGANLVVLGVRRMAEAPTTPVPVGPAAYAGVGELVALLRRNLAAAGLAMASSAVTAVAGEAAPVLCFGAFALFLLGMSLVTIGVRGE